MAFKPVSIKRIQRRLARNYEQSDPGQLAAQYMQQDSPLMQQARAQGLQAANRRGLLNSSIAVGEATDRTAQIAAGLGLKRSDQLEARNARLADYAFGRQKQLGEAQVQSQLQSEKYAGERGLVRARGRVQRGLQQQQIRGDVRLAKLDAQTRKELMQMERNMRFKLQKMSASDSDKSAAYNMLNAIQSNFQQEFRTIMSNTSIAAEDRQQLLQAARDRVAVMGNFVGDLFGIPINWDSATVGGGNANP